MKLFIAALLLASPAYASQPAIFNCGPDTYVSADKGEIGVTTNALGTATPAKSFRQFNLKWGFRGNILQVWLNGKECKYVEHDLPPS